MLHDATAARGEMRRRGLDARALTTHFAGESHSAWTFEPSTPNFLGQEVVWKDDAPVWAMSYYGYILRPDRIDATRAGATIRAALQAMYREGRFLGGFDWSGPHGAYRDRSTGDVAHFQGRECIVVDAVEAYALDYFGGLIQP